jgi:hypothetical protein
VARLQANAKTCETLVRKGLDPVEAGNSVARFHRARIADAKANNRRVLNILDIREKTFVDGKLGAPLESVKLNGGNITTVFPFPVREILEYIDYLLITRSPVGEPPEPTYGRSHRLFADGVETDPQNPEMDAKTWIFTSNVPYARKIERGQGSAPKEGVYQGAAALANRKFGNIASIHFGFEAISEGGLQNYSAVALGGRKAGRTASASKRAARQRHLDLRFPAIRIRLR